MDRGVAMALTERSEDERPRSRRAGGTCPCLGVPGLGGHRAHGHDARHRDVRLHALPHHRNLVGGLHGGIIGILADTATGVAMHSAIWPERTHVTVQLDLHFLERPSSDRIVATGTAIRAGRRIGYAEAEISDDAGTLVATASATFAISERRRQSD